MWIEVGVEQISSVEHTHTHPHTLAHSAIEVYVVTPNQLNKMIGFFVSFSLQKSTWMWTEDGEDDEEAHAAGMDLEWTSS